MSEQLQRFGADARLCGILNMPSSAIRENGCPAVIFITAGLLHKPGPFRLHVELSRTLAAMGVPALRFDLSGIGESGRAHGGESAEQSSVTDVRDVMDTLEQEMGIRRFILAGLCSGAEVAHRTAVQDSRVCGVVAMDGYIVRTPAFYVWHYLPRVFNMRKWLDFAASRLQRFRARAGRANTATSAEEDALAFWEGPGPDRAQLAAEFDALSRRQVRQLQVFSAGSGDYSYARQFQDAFGDVDFRDLLSVRFLAGTDHMYVLQSDRRRLMRIITRWIGEHFIAATAPARTRLPATRSPHPGLPSGLSSGVSHDLGHSANLAERRNMK